MDGERHSVFAAGEGKGKVSRGGEERPLTKAPGTKPQLCYISAQFVKQLFPVTNRLHPEIYVLIVQFVGTTIFEVTALRAFDQLQNRHLYSGAIRDLTERGFDV